MANSLRRHPGEWVRTSVALGAVSPTDVLSLSSSNDRRSRNKIKRRGDRRDGGQPPRQYRGRRVNDTLKTEEISDEDEATV